MAGEIVALLVAAGTVIGGVITALASRRAAATGAWSNLVTALEKRIEALEKEQERDHKALKDAQALIVAQGDVIGRLRVDVTRVEEQNESQRARITTLERKLRQLGINPDDIRGHPV